MKASIGAACSNNASRNCHPVDGSNASAPSDKAAWENIQNATNGKDLSGGGNMFCVGNEDCAVVHSCREIVNARHPAGRVRERVTPLTTSGTATLNGTTVYFYHDSGMVIVLLTNIFLNKERWPDWFLHLFWRSFS
ncbi:hypothetical protein ACLB1E_22885 [Escherichia coli]